MKQGDEAKEEWVIDMGIGKLEIDEIVPEWRRRRDVGSLFHKDQVKHAMILLLCAYLYFVFLYCFVLYIVLVAC